MHEDNSKREKITSPNVKKELRGKVQAEEKRHGKTYRTTHLFGSKLNGRNTLHKEERGG